MDTNRSTSDPVYYTNVSKGYFAIVEDKQVTGKCKYLKKNLSLKETRHNSYKLTSIENGIKKNYQQKLKPILIPLNNYLLSEMPNSNDPRRVRQCMRECMAELLKKVHQYPAIDEEQDKFSDEEQFFQFSFHLKKSSKSATIMDPTIGRLCQMSVKTLKTSQTCQVAAMESKPKDMNYDGSKISRTKLITPDRRSSNTENDAFSRINNECNKNNSKNVNRDIENVNCCPELIADAVGGFFINKSFSFNQNSIKLGRSFSKYGSSKTKDNLSSQELFDDDTDDDDVFSGDLIGEQSPSQNVNAYKNENLNICELISTSENSVDMETKVDTPRYKRISRVSNFSDELKKKTEEKCQKVRSIFKERELKAYRKAEKRKNNCLYSNVTSHKVQKQLPQNQSLNSFKISEEDNSSNFSFKKLSSTKNEQYNSESLLRSPIERDSRTLDHSLSPSLDKKPKITKILSPKKNTDKEKSINLPLLSHNDSGLGNDKSRSENTDKSKSYFKESEKYQLASFRSDESNPDKINKTKIELEEFQKQQKCSNIEELEKNKQLNERNEQKANRSSIDSGIGRVTPIPKASDHLETEKHFEYHYQPEEYNKSFEYSKCSSHPSSSNYDNEKIEALEGKKMEIKNQINKTGKDEKNTNKLFLVPLMSDSDSFKGGDNLTNNHHTEDSTSITNQNQDTPVQAVSANNEKISSNEINNYENKNLHDDSAANLHDQLKKISSCNITDYSLSSNEDDDHSESIASKSSVNASDVMAKTNLIKSETNIESSSDNNEEDRHTSAKSEDDKSIITNKHLDATDFSNNKEISQPTSDDSSNQISDALSKEWLKALTKITESFLKNYIDLKIQELLMKKRDNDKLDSQSKLMTSEPTQKELTEFLDKYLAKNSNLTQLLTAFESNNKEKKSEQTEVQGPVITLNIHLDVLDILNFILTTSTPPISIPSTSTLSTSTPPTFTPPTSTPSTSILSTSTPPTSILSTSTLSTSTPPTSIPSTSTPPTFTPSTSMLSTSTTLTSSINSTGASIHPTVSTVPITSSVSTGSQSNSHLTMNNTRCSLTTLASQTSTTLSNVTPTTAQVLQYQNHLPPYQNPSCGTLSTSTSDQPTHPYHVSSSMSSMSTTRPSLPTYNSSLSNQHCSQPNYLSGKESDGQLNNENIISSKQNIYITQSENYHRLMREVIKSILEVRIFFKEFQLIIRGPNYTPSSVVSHRSYNSLTKTVQLMSNLKKLLQCKWESLFLNIVSYSESFKDNSQKIHLNDLDATMHIFCYGNNLLAKSSSNYRSIEKMVESNSGYSNNTNTVAGTVQPSSSSNATEYQRCLAPGYSGGAAFNSYTDPITNYGQQSYPLSARSIIQQSNTTQVNSALPRSTRMDRTQNMAQTSVLANSLTSTINNQNYSQFQIPANQPLNNILSQAPMLSSNNYNQSQHQNISASSVPPLQTTNNQYQHQNISASSVPPFQITNNQYTYRACNRACNLMSCQSNMIQPTGLLNMSSQQYHNQLLSNQNRISISQQPNANPRLVSPLGPDTNQPIYHQPLYHRQISDQHSAMSQQSNVVPNSVPSFNINNKRQPNNYTNNLSIRHSNTPSVLVPSQTNINQQYSNQTNTSIYQQPYIATTSIPHTNKNINQLLYNEQIHNQPTTSGCQQNPSANQLASYCNSDNNQQYHNEANTRMYHQQHTAATPRLFAHTNNNQTNTRVFQKPNMVPILEPNSNVNMQLNNPVNVMTSQQHITSTPTSSSNNNLQCNNQVNVSKLKSSSNNSEPSKQKVNASKPRVTSKKQKDTPISPQVNVNLPTLLISQIKNDQQNNNSSEAITSEPQQIFVAITLPFSIDQNQQHYDQLNVTALAPKNCPTSPMPEVISEKQTSINSVQSNELQQDDPSIPTQVQLQQPLINPPTSINSVQSNELQQDDPSIPTQVQLQQPLINPPTSINSVQSNELQQDDPSIPTQVQLQQPLINPPTSIESGTLLQDTQKETTAQPSNTILIMDQNYKHDNSISVLQALESLSEMPQTYEDAKKQQLNKKNAQRKITEILLQNSSKVTEIPEVCLDKNIKSSSTPAPKINDMSNHLMTKTETKQELDKHNSSNSSQQVPVHEHTQNDIILLEVKKGDNISKIRDTSYVDDLQREINLRFLNDEEFEQDCQEDVKEVKPITYGNVSTTPKIIEKTEEWNDEVDIKFNDTHKTLTSLVNNNVITLDDDEDNGVKNFDLDRISTISSDRETVKMDQSDDEIIIDKVHITTDTYTYTAGCVNEEIDCAMSSEDTAFSNIPYITDVMSIKNDDFINIKEEIEENINSSTSVPEQIDVKLEFDENDYFT